MKDEFILAQTARQENAPAGTGAIVFGRTIASHSGSHQELKSYASGPGAVTLPHPSVTIKTAQRPNRRRPSKDLASKGCRGKVQNIRPRLNRSSERNLESRKVNSKRPTELAKWILLNIGDGIDRADIVARYFNIGRLYCGYYVDPCFSPKERCRHSRRYRYSQPRVTMTLKRLERRGLVRLIRRKQYVKKVQLTDKGKAIARELKSSEHYR